MWQAYEIITTPFDRALSSASASRRSWCVDAQGAIYVASDPKRFPATQPLASSWTRWPARLGRDRRRARVDAPMVLEAPRSRSSRSWPCPSYPTTIAQLGTVILEYSRDIYSQRVLETIRKVLRPPRSRWRSWCRWAGSGASRSPTRLLRLSSCDPPGRAGARRRRWRSRRLRASDEIAELGRDIQQYGRRPARARGAEGRGHGVRASRGDRPAHCGHRARNQQSARRHVQRDQHVQASAAARIRRSSIERCRCSSAASRRFAETVARAPGRGAAGEPRAHAARHRGRSHVVASKCARASTSGSIGSNGVTAPIPIAVDGSAADPAQPALERRAKPSTSAGA